MQANLSKLDQASRLQGLADAILWRFHSVGYASAPVAVPGLMCGVVAQLRSDPANFTRVRRGDRELVAMSMRPGDNVLL